MVPPRIDVWLWVLRISVLIVSCALAQGDLAATAVVSTVPRPAAADVAAAAAANVQGEVSAAGVARVWRADDLRRRFEGVVAIEYMGCFQDVNVDTDPDVFSTFKGIRRMSQRLGIWPDLSTNECAWRAAAGGWTLFALTPHEDAPKYGTTCWGSSDEQKATRGGLVQGIVDEESCTGNFQLRLYRVKGTGTDQPTLLAGEDWGFSNNITCPHSQQPSYG